MTHTFVIVCAHAMYFQNQQRPFACSLIIARFVPAPVFQMWVHQIHLLGACLRSLSRALQVQQGASFA